VPGLAPGHDLTDPSRDPSRTGGTALRPGKTTTRQRTCRVPSAGMGRSLVLNATYEPLGVVSARRAVVLVLDAKAEVIHSNGQSFRSERLSIDAPSVIRLRYYVRVPYQRRAPLNRRAVFLRDGGRCQYCGKKAESIDHVIPRSRGGEHTWENVVAACSRCNTAKRDRMLHETPMNLRTRPQVPRNLSWVEVSVGYVPEHWEQYLGGAA
jgi:5-methylcytosine-specific restriction endonuclease McrA